MRAVSLADMVQTNVHEALAESPASVTRNAMAVRHGVEVIRA